jgi:hypothetical protein
MKTPGKRSRRRGVPGILLLLALLVVGALFRAETKQQSGARLAFTAVRVEDKQKKGLRITGSSISSSSLADYNAYSEDPIDRRVHPQGQQIQQVQQVHRVQQAQQEKESRTVICAIVKFEEAYLDEWIDYHWGVLGFTHFYIYDNSYHFDLEQWGQEQVKAGRPVTVRHHTGLGQQTAVYQDCARRLVTGDLADSVAFLDIDEFVVLRKHERIHEFMDEYCPRGAVSLNWVTMGTDHRRAYEPLPVSHRFVQRWSNDTDRLLGNKFWHSKTITRVRDIDLEGEFNAHYVTLKEPWQRVDTHGRAFKPHGKVNMDETNEVAGIFHFRSKSFKENVEKFKRGRVSKMAFDIEKIENKIRTAEEGRELLPGDTVDKSVWKALKGFNPLYETFDKPLSPSPTPRHASNQTAAICAFLFEGDEAYIREWVDYHRMLGFSRFYLYDRTEQYDLEQWGEEQGGHVVLQRAKSFFFGREYDPALEKKKTRNACIQIAKQNGDNWLSISAVDKFLVLKQDSHVINFLSRYQESKSVGVFRYRFGTAGRRIYQPKPVTLRFQFRDPAVQLPFEKIVQLNPLVQGTGAVDTNGQSLAGGAAQYSERPTDAAVYHYYETKSMKEHLQKKYGVRGLSMKTSKKEPEIQDVFTGALPTGSVRDDTAWRNMKRLNAPYAVYEKLWTP